MGAMSYVNVDGLIADLNYMNTPQAAELRKALDSNSGYDGYSLEAQVKRLLPAYTVLRNRFATDTEPMSSMAGKQTHYKAQLGFGTFNFPQAMGTAFGGNGRAPKRRSIKKRIRCSAAHLVSYAIGGC